MYIKDKGYVGYLSPIRSWKQPWVTSKKYGVSYGEQDIARVLRIALMRRGNPDELATSMSEKAASNLGSWVMGPTHRVRIKEVTVSRYV